MVPFFYGKRWTNENRKQCPAGGRTILHFSSRSRCRWNDLAFCQKKDSPEAAPRPPEATLALARSGQVEYSNLWDGQWGEGERERQRERAGGQFPSDWRPTEEITAEGERYSGRPGRRGRRRAKYLPRGLWEHKGEWEREGQSPKGRQSDRPEWPAPIERERMKGRPRPAARQTVRAAAADANGDNADTKF